MNTVYIGIGSNIDAENNLQKCAELLRESHERIHFSSVYKTAARDVEDQEDFLNAVCKVETDTAPSDVHNALQAIEQQLGKKLEYAKGPRTIDLDILLYEDEMIEAVDLQIPHPSMHERRFVLEPLCEVLDAETIFPGSATSIGELLEKTLDQDCEKVDFTL